MPIDITCDKCKLELTVDDAHGGKKGRCPQCGAIMQIPMPGQGAKSTQPKPAPAPPRQQPPRPPSPPMAPKPTQAKPDSAKKGSSSAIAVGSDDSVNPYSTPQRGTPVQQQAPRNVAAPPRPAPPKPRPGTGPVPPPSEEVKYYPPTGVGGQAPVSSGEFSPVDRPNAPTPRPAPPGQGTGMYCQDCNREITVQEPLNKVAGDVLCIECYNKRFGLGASTGDPVLDAIGLNIPGLVVLKGKQEREIGRLMQDASAKEEHKRIERKQQQVSGEVNCEIPVAKLLAKSGMLQRDTYIEIKKYQRQNKAPIFDALTKFKVIEESQLAQMMSENTSIPFFQYEELPVDPGAKTLLSRETIQMYYVLPLSKQGETLNIAVVNPYDRDALEDVEKVTGLEISPVICTFSAFMAALQKNFG